MKINEDNQKSDYFFQDININSKSLTHKIFSYFYSLFQIKRNKVFLVYILMFVETIQFISYAFTPVHYDSWKLDLNNIKLLSNIIGAFRISTLMQFLDYKIYCIILYFLIISIFIICLIIIIQILFGDFSSKLYRFSINIIKKMIDIISILFYIPITEIILIPIKCVNDKVYGVKDGETCWQSMHYLNVTLGIIGAILLFIWCIFLICFNFYPFQKNMSAKRINSTNDIVIIILKLFIVLQNLLINNEFCSLFVLLLISIIIFYKCFNEPTYNNSKLETFINIKHLIIFWVYFILLIAKLFRNYALNDFIYLLLLCFPIIVFFSILISKERQINYKYIFSNYSNVNDYIKKAKYIIELVDSFIEMNNNNLRNGNESQSQKNLILLEGNIKIHNSICDDKDCPLTKYTKNEGNFNIQRQCLLNYMNIFFNKALKKFPNDVNLLMLCIEFNYSKKFNLNSVKMNMFQLKRIECTIKERFIIYCLEQNMKNNGEFNLNINNDQDNDSQIDITGQKYKKLKYLIENSIKLYAEFWGIFATNITNNINTNKLYSLGEKINKYLNEINNLWENYLKNRRISNDYQNVVQLYSKFLLEILLNKNKSKEVSKKLNEENLNNFFQKDDINLKVNSNNGIEKLESLVDNQDYLLFCDSDEKGNCKIIQCSASFSYLLSFQKYDIIGKSLEIIFPSVLIEDLKKYFEKSILLIHNENIQKYSSYEENINNSNNYKLIMAKNRMGYVIPLYASFAIFDDNDYSDSFIIKIKMEYKESRSEYAYYVLANEDFFITNISSSAINLGLSLDLLRKYEIKINNLLRTEKNEALNIFEKYNKFEDEKKSITWIFPDIMYPKDKPQDNNDKDKEKDIEEEIENFIKVSKEKKLNLQIKIIKSNDNEIIAFVFKFTEISLNKGNKLLTNDSYIPKSDKKIIIFDLLNLSYIRSLIVEEKSGLRNLRNIEDISDKEEEDLSPNHKNKKSERVKKKIILEEADSSDDSGKEIDNYLLTKEKILELQANNFLEIKAFIFSLPLYGSEVSLEKFRPSGEKYSATKLGESLIKIKLSKFCKLLEEQYHVEELFKKKKNKNNNNLQLNSPKSSKNNNNLNLTNTSDLSMTNSSISSSKGEEIHKNLASDSSSILSTVFKADSIKYITILMFFTFLEILLFVSLEFIIINNQINKIKRKINYFYNGYNILDVMIYTKYFVTEGVIANELNENYYPVKDRGNLENFLINIKDELILLRGEFINTYDSLPSSDLTEEYTDFTSKTKINIYTINVNRTEIISFLFNSAMTRIPSLINDLILDPTIMEMKNRNTYELMLNLINEYFINWKKVVIIFLKDCEKSTEFNIPLLVIMFCFFIVSITIFIIFLKVLSEFTNDREKPVILLLAIKKVVFENLKNAAESFSNKLLNKFFGNEDDEEESKVEYQTKINPKDINIVKFRAANEKKSSIINAFSFMEIVFVIMIFLLVYMICSIIKYFDFKNRMNNISQFISLFDKINIAQTNIIISLDIFKSYLYNKTIPVLNTTNTEEQFIETFMDLSEYFEDLIFYFAETKSFLKGEFLQRFRRYLYGNINEILESSFVERNKISLKTVFAKGLKSCKTKLIESIKYIIIKYFNSVEQNDGETDEENNDQISAILSEPEPIFKEMNNAVQYVMKHWYKNVIKLMINYFYEYKNKISIFSIVFFICLIVLDILFYSIIWRSYEEKLKLLLKESIDLINLIPLEIKNIIIEKLNE